MQPEDDGLLRIEQRLATALEPALQQALPAPLGQGVVSRLRVMFWECKVNRAVFQSLKRALRSQAHGVGVGGGSGGRGGVGGLDKLLPLERLLLLGHTSDHHAAPSRGSSSSSSSKGGGGIWMQAVGWSWPVGLLRPWMQCVPTSIVRRFRSMFSRQYSDHGTRPGEPPRTLTWCPFAGSFVVTMKACVLEQPLAEGQRANGRQAGAAVKVDVAVSEFQFTVMELLSRPGTVSVQLKDIKHQTHLPLRYLESIMKPMLSPEHPILCSSVASAYHQPWVSCPALAFWINPLMVLAVRPSGPQRSRSFNFESSGKAEAEADSSTPTRILVSVPRGMGGAGDSMGTSVGQDVKGPSRRGGGGVDPFLLPSPVRACENKLERMQAAVLRLARSRKGRLSLASGAHTPNHVGVARCEQCQDSISPYRLVMSAAADESSSLLLQPRDVLRAANALVSDGIFHPPHHHLRPFPHLRFVLSSSESEELEGQGGTGGDGTGDAGDGRFLDEGGQWRSGEGSDAGDGVEQGGVSFESADGNEQLKFSLKSQQQQQQQEGCAGGRARPSSSWSVCEDMWNDKQMCRGESLFRRVLAVCAPAAEGAGSAPPALSEAAFSTGVLGAALMFPTRLRVVPEGGDNGARCSSLWAVVQRVIDVVVDTEGAISGLQTLLRVALRSVPPFASLPTESLGMGSASEDRAPAWLQLLMQFETHPVLPGNSSENVLDELNGSWLGVEQEHDVSVALAAIFEGNSGSGTARSRSSSGSGSRERGKHPLRRQSTKKAEIRVSLRSFTRKMLVSTCAKCPVSLRLLQLLVITRKGGGGGAAAPNAATATTIHWVRQQLALSRAAAASVGKDRNSVERDAKSRGLSSATLSAVEILFGLREYYQRVIREASLLLAASQPARKAVSLSYVASPSRGGREKPSATQQAEVLSAAVSVAVSEAIERVEALMMEEIEQLLEMGPTQEGFGPGAATVTREEARGLARVLLDCVTGDASEGGDGALGLYIRSAVSTFECLKLEPPVWKSCDKVRWGEARHLSPDDFSLHGSAVHFMAATVLSASVRSPPASPALAVSGTSAPSSWGARLWSVAARDRDRVQEKGQEQEQGQGQGQGQEELEKLREQVQARCLSCDRTAHSPVTCCMLEAWLDVVVACRQEVGGGESLTAGRPDGLSPAGMNVGGAGGGVDVDLDVTPLLASSPVRSRAWCRSYWRQCNAAAASARHMAEGLSKQAEQALGTGVEAAVRGDAPPANASVPFNHPARASGGGNNAGLGATGNHSRLRARRWRQLRALEAEAWAVASVQQTLAMSAVLWYWALDAALAATAAARRRERRDAWRAHQAVWKGAVVLGQSAVGGGAEEGGGGGVGGAGGRGGGERQTRGQGGQGRSGNGSGWGRCSGSRDGIPDDLDLDTDTDTDLDGGDSACMSGAPYCRTAEDVVAATAMIARTWDWASTLSRQCDAVIASLASSLDGLAATSEEEGAERSRLRTSNPTSSSTTATGACERLISAAASYTQACDLEVGNMLATASAAVMREEQSRGGGEASFGESSPFGSRYGHSSPDFHQFTSSPDFHQFTTEFDCNATAPSVPSPLSPRRSDPGNSVPTVDRCVVLSCEICRRSVRSSVRQYSHSQDESATAPPCALDVVICMRGRASSADGAETHYRSLGRVLV